MDYTNAGLLLRDAQRQQGTCLCIGLDPHYDPDSPINKEVYLNASYSDEGISERHFNFLHFLASMIRMQDETTSDLPTCIKSVGETTAFFSGMANYYLTIVDTAWNEGMRVFKPQSSFFEVGYIFGAYMLRVLSRRIQELAIRDGCLAFIILDAKRGDIFSTQERYIRAYLTGQDTEIFPGLNGFFNFDAMTVTTWMGDNVLEPAIPALRNGKGLILVTETSNPSGITLQNTLVSPNPGLKPTEKQEPYADLMQDALEEAKFNLGRTPTAFELMLMLTERFGRKHELDSKEGVSPLFNVLGSTVPFDEGPRTIRPDGTFLVPGFGAQGGKFAYVMPLVARGGPLEGQGVLWSSSRGHNFSWMENYGGSDDPKNAAADLRKGIAAFRKSEKEAYQEAGLAWPF